MGGTPEYHGKGQEPVMGPMGPPHHDILIAFVLIATGLFILFRAVVRLQQRRSG
jgi:hypothetical protein